VIADEEIEQQILEVSTDGRNFVSLKETGKDDRAYVYRPGTEVRDAQYRVLVVFNDGKRYYSNIVSIRESNAAARPKLLSTIVSANTVSISSPGNFQYRIADYSGRILKQGALVNGINTINMPPVAAGMYLVTFNGDGQQWTDKMIKQ
jgi:hypothetical protein